VPIPNYDNEALIYRHQNDALRGVMTDFNVNTGLFTYTPAENRFGTDVVTFYGNDSRCDSNPGTLTINISSVNDAPETVSFSTNVISGQSISTRLVGRDVEGDTLTYSIEVEPTQGVISQFNTATGNFTYIANPAAVGTDSFTYRIYDGTLYSNVSTVTISFDSNNAPVANDGAVTVGAVLNQTISGFLAATDADGDSITYAIASNPINGSINRRVHISCN